MAPKYTKWRLDQHARVISRNEESGAQLEMTRDMPAKLEMKWTRGSYLNAVHKKHVQNECNFVEEKEEEERERKQGNDAKEEEEEEEKHGGIQSVSQELNKENLYGSVYVITINQTAEKNVIH